MSLPNITFDHPKVKEWIKNQYIVAESTNNYGELFLITSNSSCDSYRLYRFFYLNGEVSLSIDFNDVKLEKIIQSLLDQVANAH